MEYTSHYSVLKKECIDYLTENQDPKKEAYYADLTFGGGGHTFALKNTSENAFVFSCDQDPDALKNGEERIKKEGDGRVRLFDTNFVNFPEIVNKELEHVLKSGGFDGILLDLGVSSHHFDEATRGFSYRFDGPLDMRMDYDNNQILSASEILERYPEKELERIFSEYGEERYSKRIAKKICEVREKEPIKTTKQLENLIFHCYPKEDRHGKTNPSTRVFQALRIEVNQELDVITQVIDRLFPLLKIKGRLAIISFHSLEDRIVKNEFKKLTNQNGLYGELLTKKPILPTPQEILENSRSRSAKLRVIERVQGLREKNKYKHLASKHQNSDDE